VIKIAAPTAWSEIALINISDGTTDMDFAAITETIDIDQGDKDVESVANVKGGRHLKKIPEGDTEITFEGYPIGIGDRDNEDAVGVQTFFHGGTDSSAPFTVSSSTTRDVYTVTIMWTDGTATSATSSVLSGNYALRANFANFYMTSAKPSFTDGIYKCTFKFKGPCRNRTGTSNITWESTDGTASMPTI